AGEIFRKSNHPALAGVITDRRQFRRRAPQAAHRSNIDDLPALLLEHDLPHGLRAKKRTREVGFDHLVPVLQLHVLNRRAPRGARVVDQNVDAAELRDYIVRKLLHVGGIFYVATEGERLDPELLKLSGSLLASLFFPRAEHDVRAHFSETLGHLPSQANRAAGDDRHAPAEIKKLFDIHREI